MVNRQELRIGSAVMWDDKIWFIQSILPLSANIEDGNGNILVADFNYDELSPVDLTPALLEQCGFKKYAGPDGTQYTIPVGNEGFKIIVFIYRSSSVMTYITYYLMGNGSYDKAEKMDIENNCTHLHQLQNLYYSLTGKELPITLK